MAEPPSLIGGIHLRVISSYPTVGVRSLGMPGTPISVSIMLAIVPAPTEFTALTLSV